MNAAVSRQEEGSTRYRFKVATVHVVREAVPPPKHTATDADKAAEIARMLIPDDDREHFGVMFLDGGNKMLSWYEAHTGGMQSATVDAKVIYRAAILAGAVSLVFFHNHPSGDVKPSQEDHHVTHRLVQAAKLLDLIVLDHIIIGSGTEKYFSFNESGRLNA